MTGFDEFRVLDHGYFKVTGVLGDDLLPLEAARMSTDNPTGVHEDKDDRLRTRLWGDKHTCYDDQTEVLVEGQGFVPWPKVTRDYKLGIWDPERRTLCYEEPLGLVDEPYKGPMYRVDHGGVDLLVTPQHKMWVQLYKYDSQLGHNTWTGTPELISAEELGQRSMVRYCKIATFCGPYEGEISLAELRLMGFFIGDGSARDSRTNGITFHIKKKRKVDFLREICEEEGLSLRQLSNNTYVVDRGGIALNYQALFYTEEGKKDIPSFMWELPAPAARAVLEGLRASDGSEKRSTWQYSTSVERVAEGVQLLALHAGEAAHINQSGGMWNVMFLSRMTHPIVNQGKQQVSWEEYEGRVYCARTRTGILVVRRNGKIVLSGNSPFEMNQMQVEMMLPMFCLRQIDRHRTIRISNENILAQFTVKGVPIQADIEMEIEDYDEHRVYTNRNEFSGRYSTMPDAYYIPPDSRFRAKGVVNKQGSAELLDEGIRIMAREVISDTTRLCREAYNTLIEHNVASELARMVLPQNQYTKIRMSACLLHWLKFLDLRMRPDVQEETRAYAQCLAHSIRRAWPKCWDVFEEHTLYATTLTRTDRFVMHQVLGAGTEDRLRDSAKAQGYTERQIDQLIRKLRGPEPDLTHLSPSVRFEVPGT